MNRATISHVPVGDKIFERLRKATDAEFRAVAEPLKVHLTIDREVNVVALSKKYRADAGSSFRNLFRGDHELGYRPILEDVASYVAKGIGWPPPTVKASAKDAWLEEYISRAVACASEWGDGTPSEQESEIAREYAEAVLEGRVDPPSGNMAIAAALVAGVAGVMLAPKFLMLGGLIWLDGPALGRVVPATIALIHIRKRLENETLLGTKE